MKSSKIRVIELGDIDGTKSHYQAIKVEGMFSGSVYFSKGNDGKYQESVKSGQKEVVEYLQKRQEKCPNAKFALAGYSQGAQVVMGALSKLDAKNILYVANFGDPNLYLPEGRGKNPPACRGEKLSTYRVFAPDCHANEGVLSARTPYHPRKFDGKIGLWCNDGDIVCSQKVNLSNLTGAHTTYSTDGHYEAFSRILAGRIFQAENKLTKSPSEQKPKESQGLTTMTLKNGTDKAKHNVVFLIDSTGSMASFAKFYKAEAIKMAKEVVSGGGKIALYEYRDLRADSYGARQLCDFNCNLSEFEEKIGKIEFDGGGDTPESALFAIKMALNQLEWQYGATKSAILLSDASFHNPELDGTTVEMIAKRALEIDPVNVYVLSDKKQEKAFSPLVEATNGKFFELNHENLQISTETILARPVAILPMSEYITKQYLPVKFDASSSYAESGIDHFEWDLDMDGKFEQKTTDPVVRKVYSSEKTGFIQVKVVDKKGKSATMSAKVIVTEKNERAEIIEMKTEQLENGLKISYKMKNAVAVLIMFENYEYGVTRENFIEIRGNGSDLQGEKMPNFTLTAISENGRKGKVYRFIRGKLEIKQAEEETESEVVNGFGGGSGVSELMGADMNIGGNGGDKVKEKTTIGDKAKNLPKNMTPKVPDTGVAMMNETVKLGG